jgi:NTP pyrophosphatase (non-canonical NTP hydrolase)
MTFDEYQNQTKSYELMQRSETINANDPAHVAKILGLVGEAGEVAEKYKKIIRDKAGKITPEDAQEIIKELGDVLWYVAVLADYLGMPLEAVAEANLQKLSSRKARGVQAGSGDNR